MLKSTFSSTFRTGVYRHAHSLRLYKVRDDPSAPAAGLARVDEAAAGGRARAGRRSGGLQRILLRLRRRQGLRGLPKWRPAAGLTRVGAALASDGSCSFRAAGEARAGLRSGAQWRTLLHPRRRQCPWQSCDSLAATAATPVCSDRPTVGSSRGLLADRGKEKGSSVVGHTSIGVHAIERRWVKREHVLSPARSLLHVHGNPSQLSITHPAIGPLRLALGRCFPNLV